MRKYTQDEVLDALYLMDLTGFDFDNDLPDGTLNHDQIIEIIDRCKEATKRGVELRSESDECFEKAQRLQSQAMKAIDKLERFAIQFSDDWCNDAD